jgi:hypothetical protein
MCVYDIGPLKTTYLLCKYYMFVSSIIFSIIYVMCIVLHPSPSLSKFIMFMLLPLLFLL